MNTSTPCESRRTGEGPTLKLTHLLADVLPLAVQLIQLLLDVDGERGLGLFLQVQTHLVDAVHTGLDGVDVIHQSLVSQTGHRKEYDVSHWNR